MERRPGHRRPARPGSHALRSEVVDHHRRGRIMEAAKSLFAERGYRAVTVSDIVKSSRVARARFYEQFASREDCFFAVYDAVTEAALQRVGRACEGTGEDFPERVAVSVAALLEAIETDPEGARICILEGPAVGPPITERFEGLIGDFAVLLRSAQIGDEAERELPTTVEETVVGGLYWLLYYALLEGRPRKLARLRPQLIEFSLIPFIGAEAAAAAAAA